MIEFLLNIGYNKKDLTIQTICSEYIIEKHLSNSFLIIKDVFNIFPDYSLEIEKLECYGWENYKSSYKYFFVNMKSVVIINEPI